MGRLRTVGVLVVAYVWLSAATGVPRALQLMHGIRVSREAAAGPLQYTREGVLVLLAYVLLRELLDRKRRVREPVSRYVIVAGIAAVGLSLRSLVRGVEPLAIVFGLRIVTLWVVFAAVRWFDPAERRRVVRVAARYAKPVILVEVLVAAYQIVGVRGVYGVTVLGARPWGTLASPNNLGVFGLALVVVMYAARPRHWRTWMCLAAFLPLVSGSRTGVLGLVLIAGGVALRNVRLRGLLFPAALGVFVLLLLFASSQAVSGRQISGEGRFDHWQILTAELGRVDWLVGEGVGVGSNATTVAFGSAGGGVVADSMVLSVLMSFGLVGVALLLAGVVKVWRLTPWRLRLVHLPVIYLAGSVFVLSEISPANLIFTIVAASVTQGTLPSGDIRSSPRPPTLTQLRR